MMNYRSILIMFHLLYSLDLLSAQTIVKQFEQTCFNIKDLSLLNATTGWAIGSSHWDQVNKKFMSTLLKTEDAGDTWIKQVVESEENLWGICFVNASSGWVVGDAGTILYTGDGGVNWTRQNAGTVLDLRSVHFSDTIHGWVIANEIIHYNQLNEADAWHGRVFHTGDGGKSWSEQFLPSDAGIIHQVYFQDALTGWALGVKNLSISLFVQATGAAYYTADGGQTWEEKYIPQLDLVFTDIDFVNDRQGWMIGFASKSSETGGTIFRTSDGGANWQRIPENKVLWEVDFIDSLNGYAVGADYISAWGPPVLRTMDGGLTWQKIKMAKQDSQGLYGLVVLTDKVIAIGDEGYLVISNDPWGDFGSNNGEELFNQQLINDLYEFEDVFFYNQSLGWAVGRKSISPDDWAQIIFHTEDGGQNWTEQYSFTGDWLSYTLRLDAVQFVSEMIGWACGHSVDVGTNQTTGILFTNDGGQTWQQQAQGVAVEEMVDLYFFDDQTGWVLTSARSYPAGNIQLLKTTSGGTSWDLIDTGQPGLITIGFAIRSGKIFFQNQLSGWVLGAQSDLIKTVDGGVTWTPVSLPEDWYNTYSIAFCDEQNGTICGETKFRTDDGGNNWIKEPLGSQNFTDLIFTPAGHGWMVGERGRIYQTVDKGLNWIAIDHTVTTNALKAVSFCDGQHGWVAGRAGIILKIDASNTGDIGNKDKHSFDFTVFQNFPNPFNPETIIPYTLTTTAYVKIAVYNIAGHRIKILTDGLQLAGDHQVSWDGTNSSGKKVASGVYFYHISAERMTRIRKMILLQ